MMYNIKEKRKTNKDMDYINSSRRFRPLVVSRRISFGRYRYSFSV